jgi:hypothetical protein
LGSRVSSGLRHLSLGVHLSTVDRQSECSNQENAHGYDHQDDGLPAFGPEAGGSHLSRTIPVIQPDLGLLESLRRRALHLATLLENPLFYFVYRTPEHDTTSFPAGFFVAFCGGVRPRSGAGLVVTPPEPMINVQVTSPSKKESLSKVAPSI